MKLRCRILNLDGVPDSANEVFDPNGVYCNDATNVPVVVGDYDGPEVGRAALEFVQRDGHNVAVDAVLDLQDAQRHRLACYTPGIAGEAHTVSYVARDGAESAPVSALRHAEQMKLMGIRTAHDPLIIKTCSIKKVLLHPESNVDYRIGSLQEQTCQFSDEGTCEATGTLCWSTADNCFEPEEVLPTQTVQVEDWPRDDGLRWDDIVERDESPTHDQLLTLADFEDLLDIDSEPR